MKTFSIRRETGCFLLIFLCFLWTSSGYLSWLYQLMESVPGGRIELYTEVVGYLFQALGLGIFALAVKRRPELAGAVPFAVAAAADFLSMIPAAAAESLPVILGSGYVMNLLHGVIAGFYLYRLAGMPDWHRRAFTFGLAYGTASIGSWFLSLIGEANFLHSRYVLIVYGILAALSVFIALQEKPAESYAARIGYQEDSPPAMGLLILAAGSVFLLSLVKNLGFAFPAADIEQGISLEFSRAFYAVGLGIAGFVSDRERKYGAVCCVALLSIPFLLLALRDELGVSVILWSINYLLFGFFTVFRVILFSDISRKAEGVLYLSGLGLLFGRLGDAAGSFGCISLGKYPVILLTVSAVLFAVTVFFFFLLYQRVYLPPPLPEKSEQQRFDEFADHFELSPREREVLRLLMDGQSNPEMASNLYISESTVKFHIRNLLRKTGCENRVSLLALYRSEKDPL